MDTLAELLACAACGTSGDTHRFRGESQVPNVDSNLQPPIWQASQASRQLRQNLEEEGCHVAEFLLTVGQTIAPLQQVLDAERL